MILDVHGDTVGIFIAAVPVNGDIVRVGFHVGVFGCGGNFDRVRVDAPLGDVQMMGPPVRHLTAGIFIPPAEIVMSTFRDVGCFRSLSLPEIPIESLGDFVWFKWAALNVFTKDHIDLG